MNKYWLFQSNPMKYDQEKCLKKDKILHWKDNSKGVTLGDIAYFIECGKLKHIRGKGEIVSNPKMIDKSDYEKENKCLKTEFKKDLRVKVKIIQVLREPIKIEGLKDHPILKNNTIFKYINDKGKSQQRSCFEMTEEEAKSLEKLFA